MKYEIGDLFVFAPEGRIEDVGIIIDIDECGTRSDTKKKFHVKWVFGLIQFKHVSQRFLNQICDSPYYVLQKTNG
jgi:hypothetical protein